MAASPYNLTDEQIYERKLEEYKKLKELQRNTKIPVHECMTCDELTHAKSKRCQWCKQAQEATIKSGKNFKECRAVLERVKREIEGTTKERIDGTISIEWAKILIENKTRGFKPRGTEYNTKESRLKPLRPYEEVRNTEWQKETRKLRREKSASFQRQQKKTRLSEMMAVAKQEERKMYDYRRQQLREMPDGEDYDRSGKARMDFYNDRILKPGRIGQIDYWNKNRKRQGNG